METRENKLHEPILEEVNEERTYVEHYFRVKCPICYTTLCGSSDKKYLEEEVPNFCPECGARLKEVDE